MNVAPPPDPNALTAEDTARLADLVAGVLADKAPAKRLRRELEVLDQEARPALSAALFESLAYRTDVRDYWVFFRMWKNYEALGPARQDAAFFAASQAVQLAPEASGAGQAFRAMFHYLRERGRFAEAVEVFRHQLNYAPEQPSVEPWEIGPVLRAIGEPWPDQHAPASAPGDRIDHTLFDAEVRAPWSCATVDGVVPLGLQSLATETWRRPAVGVAELRDAEVMLFEDTVIVSDRSGLMHGDLCIAAFPAELRRKLQREEANGRPIPLHEADEAVVIADYCPPPNLCHFLLDQLSRLALYQKLGVDTSRAVVVAADPRGTFRENALRRAGVTNVLSTNRLTRLRARRLFVSSNCRDVRHFAHWGAQWAVDFVRKTLGGQGSKGWRRLYVSRSDADRRRVTNEAEIAALLEPHGFEVIVPGRMSYDAQVAAFRQASHVIAPHGAALAHLVLCPPEARVLEIFHPLFTENAFAMQMQAADLTYVAMVARDGQSDAPEWNDPRGAKEMRFYAGRNMRVELDALSRYLATIG